MEFRDNEIARIKGKEFPVIGGRLRLAHENSEHLQFESIILADEPERAVVRSVVSLDHGKFTGLGSANAQDDDELAGSLVELAQTRSVARALRFAGYGVEVCGVEELRGDPIIHNDQPSQAQQTQSQTNGNLATQPQITLIEKLANKLGLSEDLLNQKAQEEIGVASIEQLTKVSASQLIQTMNEEIAKQKGKGNGKNGNGSFANATH